MAKELLVETVHMSPVPTFADARSVPEGKGGFFRCRIERLFSANHFLFKLLLGTGVGVLMIVVVAVACVVWTFRNQQQEQFRTHTIEVMRLSSVVENDIAEVENAYRGHLLTRNAAELENFSQLQAQFMKHCEELTGALRDDSPQRKRVLRMREIVLKWLPIIELRSVQRQRNPRRI